MTAATARWLLAGSLAVIGPAWSADVVTDAIQAAYVPYRAALFRTNSQAQAESEQAVALAQLTWRRVGEQYAATPPPPYDHDPAFATTVADVAAVYARAAQQVGDRRLVEAHETLEQVRELLAELRHRNDVVVYSDAMNAYHAQMEQVLKSGPQWLASPHGWMPLMGQVGALAYLAERLRSEAPRRLRDDADFVAQLRAVEASVAALRAAMIGQDASGVRDALGKLKSPYSRMFLKYG